jgi:(p)ppGpp synthase/HD superfamily hydrolase
VTDAVHDQQWYGAALAFVRSRHQGRLDALGAPYYQHFERVAHRLVRLFPNATRGQIEAALLHDVMEPADVPVDLTSLDLDSEAARIIARITLPTDGRSYLQYAADLAASGDVAAIQVKLADNLDATEFYSTRPDPSAQHLVLEQYDPTRRILQDALIAAAEGTNHG